MNNSDFQKPRRQSARGLVLIFIKEGRRMVKIFWPIILPLVFNKGLDNKFLWFLLLLILSLILLSVHAFLYYRNFKFFIKDDQFILKKGYLNRTTLSIPLTGIQNVKTNQSVLQQALEVMSVKVDTAGTADEELTIHALDSKLAVQLARALSAHIENQAEKDTGSAKISDQELEILHLSNRDLLKIGISQNHLKTLVLLFFLGLQFYYQMEDYFEEKAKEYSTDLLLFLNHSSYTLLLAMAIGFLFLAILYSMIRTLILYYDLRFLKLKDTYRIVSGLLNRKNLLIPFHKIQQFNWETGPIKRLFGLYQINIRQATSQAVSRNQLIEIPGCLTDHLDQIRQDLFGPDMLSQQPKISSSKIYFRRNWLLGGWIPSVLFGLLGFSFWEFAVIAGLWLIFSFWYSWHKWKKSYFFLNNHQIRVSSGAISHKYQQMEFHKVQHLEFRQSIFLKRHQVGSLRIGNSSGSIRIPFIDANLARILHDYLLFYAETSSKSWM